MAARLSMASLFQARRVRMEFGSTSVPYAFGVAIGEGPDHVDMLPRYVSNVKRQHSFGVSWPIKPEAGIFPAMPEATRTERQLVWVYRA